MTGVPGTTLPLLVRRSYVQDLSWPMGWSGELLVTGDLSLKIERSLEGQGYLKVKDI